MKTGIKGGPKED